MALLAIAPFAAHGEPGRQPMARDAAGGGGRVPLVRVDATAPSTGAFATAGAARVQGSHSTDSADEGETELRLKPARSLASMSNAQKLRVPARVPVAIAESWGEGASIADDAPVAIKVRSHQRTMADSASEVADRVQRVHAKHFIPATEDRMRWTSGAEASFSIEEAPHRISTDELTLLNSVGIAISRHPAIGRAKAVIAQGTSEVAIAKAAWYPKIEYGVRPGYGGNFGSEGNQSGARATAGVNQLIYDFGRTTNRIAAADATLNRQQYQLADVIESTASDTASIFIELAASQDIVAAAQRQVTTLQETRSKILDRVRAGLSATSDRNLIDVALHRAEADVLKANTRFDVAAAKLAEIIGLRPRHVAALGQTGLQIYQLGSENGDTEQTPAILAASAAVDAANASLKVAESESYPSITIGASRARSTGRANAADDTWIGLSLSGNFPFGGLTKHRVGAAEAERRAALETLENQRLVARTALASARIEAKGASARLENHQKVIELSRSSRDLYWQEYTLNKRPLTEVINPDRDIYQAEVEFTSAVADGLLARVKAHVAAGRFVELLRQQDQKI
ncbi:adhesin transport system outer membrane protein [Variovorax boronicumulans]|uniref:TolC family protein n=1 Tax=Variovorax boronicumulans TaxID=436515 RepID=UPI0027827C83|nr:TolC family protein [Variovorax boronicumulans]MDP9992629.1 adhesin transport system outer membrane protein [Variovorax boronicumulans]MDQ0002199.1 adhesin transport system outer membrane protein [Variovorax boronicumulans]